MLVNKCVGATYKDWYSDVYNCQKCANQHRLSLTLNNLIAGEN